MRRMQRACKQSLLTNSVTQTDPIRVRPWLEFTALLPDKELPRRERAKVLDWNRLLADAVQVALDAEMADVAAARNGPPGN